VPALTPSQLRSAAADFWDSAAGESLTDKITASASDKSKHCREAQNTLRAAVESADSAIVTATLINRLSKVKDGKEVRGGWATPAQDGLRASIPRRRFV